MPKSAKHKLITETRTAPTKIRATMRTGFKPSGGGSKSPAGLRPSRATAKKKH